MVVRLIIKSTRLVFSSSRDMQLAHVASHNAIYAQNLESPSVSRGNNYYNYSVGSMQSVKETRVPSDCRRDATAETNAKRRGEKSRIPLAPKIKPTTAELLSPSWFRDSAAPATSTTIYISGRVGINIYKIAPTDAPANFSYNAATRILRATFTTAKNDHAGNSRFTHVNLSSSNVQVGFNAFLNLKWDMDEKSYAILKCYSCIQ